MPAFDVVGTAQRWFDRAWSNGAADADKLAAMQALLEAADVAMMDGSKVGDVINGNMNGASFTMRVDALLQYRLKALELAINGLNNSIRPSRTARAYFPQA